MTTEAGRQATRWIAVMLLAVAGMPPADATGIAQLGAFLQGTKSGRATFTQEVAAKGARPARGASGTFTFLRPGKFRWSYEKPYEQLIVGDGDKVWIYDRDLNQVIVRKLDVALGANPAALLAGDNALERHFDLADGGVHAGLEWILAKPKSPDSGFEHVTIGFRENLPRVMELKDAFANVTTLVFGTFERNAVLDAATFRFAPPPGADVVGE
jgi:outer membrane lipoprotein carrier protein